MGLFARERIKWREPRAYLKKKRDGRSFGRFMVYLNLFCLMVAPAAFGFGLISIESDIGMLVIILVGCTLFVFNLGYISTTRLSKVYLYDFMIWRGDEFDTIINFDGIEDCVLTYESYEGSPFF